MSNQLQVTGIASFKSNVGIGTTNPLTTLSVENSGTQNVISPIITSQSTGVTYAGMYSIRDGAGDQRGMLFQNFTANVGLTEKMRITSVGNILIGTTTDAGYKLDVNGSINVGASSQLYLTSGDLRYNSNAGFGIVSQNGGRLVTIQNGAFGVNGAATFSSTINATGVITTNAPAGLVIQPTTTTNQGYLTVVNASGSCILGIDNSAGTTLGAGAYSRFLYNTGAYPLDFYTNAQLRARITSGGNVLIATGIVADSGEKLQVSGITKTAGLSLSGTTVSTSQTITSTFYMWIFNGASGQTLTLYSPSGHNNTHFIKNSSANSLTLATSGNNIETLTSTTAVSSITIPAFKTVEVISNGGGVWIVMNQS